MESRSIVQRLSTSHLLRPSHRTCPQRLLRPSRSFSSTSAVSEVWLSPREEYTSDPESIPRWRQTPKSMKMPFQVRQPAKQVVFNVNEDPDKLHRVYDKILGKDGWRGITEDTRWLAVTHKSFDQGRRGFNARLSYLGKRIVELQYSLAVLSSPNVDAIPYENGDGVRLPFSDSKLKGLETLTAEAKAAVLHHHRIGQLGESYGLDKVIRWKPKITSDLPSSGLHMVTAQALYAIIGAVSLERGGMDANRVVKEKILKPFGLQVPS